MKLSRITALRRKKLLGSWPSGSKTRQAVDALCSKMLCEALRRLLAAAVAIGIEGQIDSSWAVAELPKLVRIEMVAQRAGDVVKTGLPQHGIVEQPLDENHFRVVPDLLPAIQATFGARQETGEVAPKPKAAAIEIAFQRKDDAVDVCIVASGSHQTGLTQIAERDNPTASAKLADNAPGA